MNGVYTQKNPYDVPDMDWCLKSFMVPHSSIRCFTDKLYTACTAMMMQIHQHQTFAPKMQYLADWYSKYYFDFVHHHHEIEEEDFFPWLNKILMERGGMSIPDNIGGQHEKLLSDLKYMKDELYAIVELARSENSMDPMATKLPEDKTSVARLEKMTLEVLKPFVLNLYSHLDDEERVIVPLIRQYVSKEEMDAKETEIVQGLGLSAARLMIPQILFSMDRFDTTKDKKHVNGFYYNIPPPLRLLNWIEWQRNFLTNNLQVIEALGENRMPSGGMCCC